jgi:hypothetical protein
MINKKYGLSGNGMKNGSPYSELYKGKYMDAQQQMEERLWDFIDGACSPEEQSLIQKLVVQDPDWQRRYNELNAVDHILNQQETDAPSMRFTKNVMEQIARYQVAPATRSYINKNVIRGITAFFLAMIIGILIYFFGQFHWTSSPTDNLIPQYNIDANKLNWGKALNNSSVNIFILVNVILGFILLDKYLHAKKKRGNRGEAV